MTFRRRLTIVKGGNTVNGYDTYHGEFSEWTGYDLGR